MARLCIGLVAWSACGWFGAQLIDWSFAPAVPAGAVPAAGLAWVALGGCVVLRAVRRARAVSSKRRLLVFAAVPGTLLVQVALIAAPFGPPTDIRLAAELRQDRFAFDEIAALARPELEGFSLVEGDAGSESLSSRVARVVQARLPGRVVGIRQPGPCLEIVRWSAGSSTSGFEVGFLYSVRPPHLLEVPIDRETFLRDGVREYRRLDEDWYLFRAAW